MLTNRTGMLAAASFFALAIPATAFAQVDAVPAAESADDGDEAASEESSAIVVTGTRITRAGFEAPTPVSVLTTDDLIKKAPGSLTDALNQLPVFQNSINANQQQFTQGNRQRTGNYLNLRSLGTQRVLVLQDGQRLPPTGINGGVDATLVPQLLTERIDVVTGGASAAYGSDAVSGVVNFIINKRFKGVKAQAQRGISSRGDLGTYRLGVAGGTALLDDRLHVIGSLERYHTDVLNKVTRPDIARSFQAVGAGTVADPVRYVDDVRFGNISEGGFIQTGPAGFRGMQFGPGGTLIPFNTGVPSGNPGTQRGGDGALVGQSCCTITPSQTANQAFGRAEYEFTDSLTGFVSVGYNWSSNSDNPLPLVRTQLRIFNGNAFLSPATAAALGTTASFDMGKIFNNRRGNEITQRSDSLNVLTGLNGKIGDSLTWNLGFAHSKTRFRVLNVDVVNAKLYAAADAVRDPSGNIVCRVNLTNPGLYPDCIPLNPFGIASESQVAYDYVMGESRYAATNKLDSVQASVSGDLFEGWAGPISFAIGAEYRKQSLNQTSNGDPTIAPDFTGLRGTVGSGMLKFGTANVGIARGRYTVKELFGEINIPILTDSTVGTLELNGAGRVTDYSTSGTVETWKAGALYDPVEGVRFRATLSRDIRAPSLFELFAGQTSTGVTFSDRLTGTQAVSRQISGGNPNLQPEIANTLTAGVVFKPTFLPGFNFSADFFRIKIKDAIATPFSAFQLIDLCAASNYTSTLCDQIVRPLGPTNPDPANTPTAIFTNNQNVASLLLSGIDFEMSYSHDLGPGRISARALATRQIKFQQINGPGQPVRKFVGTADFNDVQFPLALPKWRGTFTLGYDTDHFSINVQERIIGAYDRTRLLVYAQNRVGKVAYTDANVTFKVPAKSAEFELFATVNNLFDKDPPLVPVTRTPGLTVPTIRSAYDIIGRYFTLGVRVKM